MRVHLMSKLTTTIIFGAHNIRDEENRSVVENSGTIGYSLREVAIEQAVDHLVLTRSTKKNRW